MPDSELGRSGDIARLEMLARATDPESLKKLFIALGSEQAVIRQVAATTLGRVRHPEAVPYLLERLHDPAVRVRQAVVWALGQIGHPRAVSGLRDALRDESSDVRRAAVWALGQLDQPRALPDLLAAQMDEDVLVRQSAQAVSAGAMPETPPRPTEAIPGRKSRSYVPWVVGIVLVLGLAAILVAARLWAQPLGPSLVTLESIPRATPPASPPARGQPPAAALCGGPTMMKLLVVGLDDEGYTRGFADTIRVARIDFVAPSVTLLAVPRDLWVSIPGLASHGISEERIKTAYPYGNVFRIPGGGPSLLAQTLKLNLGLEVDHYAAVDFATFSAGIDRIGGIDVYLPTPVGDPKTDPPYFPAGWIHMDGATALTYARARPDNTSDFARIDRQSQVIMAIRQKLLSADVLPKLPGLIDSMKGSVATDLSPAQISGLVCLMQNIEPSQVTVVTMRQPLVLPVTDSFGYERLLPAADSIREFITAFDAGNLDEMKQFVVH